MAFLIAGQMALNDWNSLQGALPLGVREAEWPVGVKLRVRLRAMALIALLALSAGRSIWAQTDTPTEHQVQAAFIYNFAKFVDWPPAAFAHDKTPITICVLGGNPFGNTLDEIAQGQSINGHAFAIRKNVQRQDVGGCHILFISNSEKESLSADFKSLEGSAILTISDMPDFAGQGGHIQFVSENHKIRFVVNTDAVERAHLKISSKLLALAKIVHDGSRQKEN